MIVDKKNTAYCNPFLSQLEPERMAENYYSVNNNFSKSQYHLRSYLTNSASLIGKISAFCAKISGSPNKRQTIRPSGDSLTYSP